MHLMAWRSFRKRTTLKRTVKAKAADTILERRIYYLDGLRAETSLQGLRHCRFGSANGVFGCDAFNMISIRV